MNLYMKYLGLLLCVFLAGIIKIKAQDATSDSPAITIGIVMPDAIEGLTDASVKQMGNKITAILTNNNLTSDDPDRTFVIYPKFDIISVEETSTTMQKLFIAHCTFSLYVKQTSTKLIFSTFTKNLDGEGYDKAGAIANAVTQIRPDGSDYQRFLDKAKVKIATYYQQNCQQFISKAQGDVAMGKYEEANKILSAIPPGTGTCYDEAQKEMIDIFNKQYGSLDKAVTYYQKQVTVDPGSGIFSKLLGRAKKLQDKRNEEDKTPPEIELITPKATRGQGVEADVTPAKKIYVSGTAKDPSGIGSVSVNGQQVSDVTPDGFFQANIDKDATDIIVAASDKKGNSTSVTFHIASKVEPKALSPDDIAPISDNETFHAIFIANTDYSGAKWPALKTTIPEARSFIKLLEDKYGFLPANVDTVFNKSRQEILTIVKDRLDKLTDNDNLVLFYGGHGYFVESTNMAYWVPINCDNEFDYISNTDITNLLNGCEARHILVMADACFSGAMRGGLDAPAKYEYKFKSRQLLTSGGTEPVPGKSAYIAMILETMNNNTDKYLSARELYTRIFKGIMDQTNTEPTIRDLKVTGSEGGQFYFRKN
jgi:hypothetical protein